MSRHAPLATPARSRRRRAVAMIAAAAVGAVATLVALPASAVEPDLARQATVTASAEQNDQDGSFPATNAIDGSATTRWASGNGPDDLNAVFTATLTADLGQTASVTSVDLAWEASYAVAYDIQVATTAPDDAASWSTVQSVTGGDGGSDVVSFAAVDARYVRLVMLQRAAATWDAPTLHYYGYSLYTFGIGGTLSTPSVRLDEATARVAGGDDYTARVTLFAPAAEDESVRVRTSDGTAVAGTDYTAVDQTLTIPAGQTTASVVIPTVDHGPLAGSTTFTVTLSEPSDGLVLGGRTTTTVTVLPNGDLPDIGPQTVVHDFENGSTGFFSWGVSPTVTPALTTTEDTTRPGAGAGNSVLVATVGGTPAAGDWFGFSNDAAADWSDADGFTFAFQGTGSGNALRYELKSGGVMYEESVVDDTVGWRQVSVLFADLRNKANPDSDDRFDPSAATGFAVTLSNLGAGEYRFDDFAVYERVVVVQDFEDSPVIDEATPGVFTFAGPDATISAAIETQERGGTADNLVLAGDYSIPSGSWAGFSDNREASQDWSSFQGIRFWWYASQTSNPASPTAGGDVRLELKDGGPDGEHAEVWTATFKDNWGSSTSRWKLVELPFSSFTLAGYQPGDEATRNGVLDLTEAWGYAISLPVGATAPTTAWSVDQFELYGTATSAADVSVATTESVYLVDQGDAATVDIAVTTRSGDPLPGPVEVEWATGDGSAQDGVHYTGDSGTVTFDAGAASGTTQSIQVQTLAVTTGEEARSIPIELTSDAATPPDAAQVVINAHGLPYLDAALPISDRVADLLGRMSLVEKVGQMAQAERLGLQSDDEIATLALGSVLSGGGSVPAGNTPEAWADMVDDYQRQALSTPLQVPLLYGADAVHGHSNVLGAVIFPHNASLGATRDPALVEAVSEITAIETKSTGVNWAFAPCLCVSVDERWGRSYESFSEDPALVTQFARPTTIGLQGEDASDMSGADEVLATAKHWAGDGGTSYDDSALGGGGYPIDQGITHVDSMTDFEATHVSPYLPALEAGVGSIMPSYSAVQVGDGPVVRMHENTELNTGLLKGELGFQGFLISDWEGIDKLPGGTYAEKAARSVNSGMDMAMAPYNYADFISAIVDGVGTGTVQQSRVDDAVRRILTSKFALGLFEQPLTDRSLQGDFGSAEHRAVARQAAADSQVLLKNDGALPLAANASVYVAGSNADDLGNQMGGWTISWQGGSGDTTTGTSIYEGMQQVAPDATFTFSKDASAPIGDAEVGVVVVGETPYAEGQGDVGNNGKSLSLSAADQNAIDTVCAAVECVVLVVSGRPQLVTDAVGEMNALVASFLPGSEGAGVADVLFGARDFTGRLPLTWPASAEQVPINVGDDDYEPLYAYGWGERTDAPRDRLAAVRDALAGSGVAQAAAVAAAAVQAAAPADEAAVVQALLDADIWAADGTLLPTAAAFQAVADAAAQLTGTAADEVVTLARDLAQQAIVDGTAVEGAAAITADAEHLVSLGQYSEAVVLFASVLDLAIVPGDPGTVDPDPGTGTGDTDGNSPAAVGDGEDELALTGTEIWLAILFGLALIAAGAVIRPAVHRRS
ncbi:glycoside hydrolase family 3 N-terminal domain-containing protein [Microbacterium sp. P05]|uniref:glycoside hydrolase family 3 N-terminal domain-containing protein n=1 Tax=Microbacterium sp. P05 TaxID=3366948 RepID=UPI00374603E0